MYRFDGSTVLVIKTDVTHTVTHQTTHILPPAGTQNALDKSHKASARQADRRAKLMSESQGQARRAAKQSGATSRASACARAPSQRCRDRVGQSPLPTPRDLIRNGALMSCESCVGSARGHSGTQARSRTPLSFGNADFIQYWDLWVVIKVR